MIPNHYEYLAIDNIEDIATKMRVLANLIGGDHVTNKEAEVELHKLADALSVYNMHINTLTSDYIKTILLTTGIV